MAVLGGRLLKKGTLAPTTGWVRCALIRLQGLEPRRGKHFQCSRGELAIVGYPASAAGTPTVQPKRASTRLWRNSPARY